VKNPCRIVLLGPPGAGKGTQSVLFARSHGLPHISTGEIMRAAVIRGDDLGLQVKSFLDRGELVPDSLVITLIEERLAEKDCAIGFVLDGFPRTVDQARALDQILSGLGRALTQVIELKVPEAVLLERIRRRGAEGSGRSDDNGEIAARRLQVYWAQTAPVTLYYKEGMGVVEVDGLGTVEEVQARLDEVVNSAKKGTTIASKGR
jgi:adenylate kinase